MWLQLQPLLFSYTEWICLDFESSIICWDSSWGDRHIPRRVKKQMVLVAQFGSLMGVCLTCSFLLVAGALLESMNVSWHVKEIQVTWAWLNGERLNFWKCVILCCSCVDCSNWALLFDYMTLNRPSVLTKIVHCKGFDSFSCIPAALLPCYSRVFGTCVRIFSMVLITNCWGR